MDLRTDPCRPPYSHNSSSFQNPFLNSHDRSFLYIEKNYSYRLLFVQSIIWLFDHIWYCIICNERFQKRNWFSVNILNLIKNSTIFFLSTFHYFLLQKLQPLLVLMSQEKFCFHNKIEYMSWPLLSSIAFFTLTDTL